MFYLLLATLSFAFPSLDLNSQQVLSQSSEWSIFQLNRTSISVDEGTLRFKLQYNTTLGGPLVLALSAGKPPYFNSDRTKVVADYVDYNGWLNLQEVSYITLPASFVNTTLQVFVGVGAPLSLSVPFTLGAEYSTGALCPNDCSGNGKCRHYRCCLLYTSDAADE